jgi:hypothetical protein
MKNKKEKKQKHAWLVNQERGKKPKLSKEEQIILTLTYLMYMTKCQLLGIQFGVSETTANDIFNYWWKILRELLPESLLEEVKKTQKNMKLFKSY